jgi:hypothetical protein
MAVYKKREKLDSVELEVNINTGISLWQAIKLRIAGKNYLPIANQIAESIKARFDREMEA